MESLTQMIDSEKKFNSMVFFQSWVKAMRRMSDAEFRKSILILTDYAFEGVEPNIEELTPLQEIVYVMAQPSIEYNIKQKLGGQKGGSAPKKPAKKGKSKSKPKEEPKPEPEPEEVQPEETRIDDSDDTYSTDADGESQKWKERQRQKEQEKREK